ncbi:signal recognition particle-docking protein FtsY [Basilea psittacipulmonis]|uniref:Signal recognition particle receptor FtsY n=1 Tax=Basilea psittacipulmonis DSM 24701 TaxID=1072685 RepID=A0A077DCZ6_9BURK|nr:signal recognition particle-docking protein FtsY [Basilea psittacipulmonis]AIL32484.1 cell division protein FtsY [Basilea psittacipulmonis DSM 24701]
MFRFFKRKDKSKTQTENQTPSTPTNDDDAGLTRESVSPPSMDEVGEPAAQENAENLQIDAENEAKASLRMDAEDQGKTSLTSTSEQALLHPVSDAVRVETVSVQSEQATNPPQVNETVDVVETPVGQAEVTNPLQVNETVDVVETPVTEAVEPAPIQEKVVAEETPAPKLSWFARLKKGLSKTGSQISTVFVGVKVDEQLFEELETALIMADSGMEATTSLLDKLRQKVKKEKITDATAVKYALRDLLIEHLKPLEKSFDVFADKPLVVMISGVNGAGKTTSIGKLARQFQLQGASVLLAAGDTFRAAAKEQLVEWGKRNQVTVIAQDGGDPAAVAFDAVNAGKARGAQVVMVDTAGRLPTQQHLMKELSKIRKVIQKANEQAPHESLLVVDGNTGQNALAQIKAFDEAVSLTGLVVTKLDGTAKGGILAAVAAGTGGVRPIPVYWIGVGEHIEDLQAFRAKEFANALLGIENE